VSGPASVIEAVAHGRRAASAIDRCLGGSGNIDPPSRVVEPELPPVEEGVFPPVHPGQRPPEERKGTFVEVELAYSPDQARREALRCLRCDLERAEEG